MLGVNQLDFINYTTALKGNYRKGVHKLEAILANPTHAAEFAANLGGVSVVLGVPIGKEDKNSEALLSLLLASSVADAAVYTWLGQFYEFTSWDDLLGDAGRCQEMMADPFIWRAMASSGVAVGKAVATLAGLDCGAYADMTAVAASSTAMAAIWQNDTALSAVQNNAEAWAIFTSASSEVMGKTVAILAGLNPDSYADMTAVAASSTAMTAVATSYIAVAAVYGSEVAVNAVKANETAWATLTGASSEVMGKAVAVLAGLNPDSYVDMTAVAASSTAMAAVTASPTAMAAIATSSMATAKYAASAAGLNPADYDDMTELAASSTAMTAVAASQTAMTAVAASSTAMAAVIANSTALNAVVSSSTAMTAVAASQTAMTAVAASSTAMTAVAASSTAMTAVAASSTAMTAVAASQTAMTAVAASSTAMTAVIANDTALNAVVASSTAMTAVAASKTALSACRASSTAMAKLAASSTALSALAASSLVTKYNLTSGNTWTTGTVNGSGIFIKVISYQANGNTATIDSGSAQSISNNTNYAKAFQSKLAVYYVPYSVSGYGIYYILC